jgi:hypothetical protein
MNWKLFGRKMLCPNFMILSRNSPGEFEENHENTNQDSRSLVRDFNLGPPEYKAEVLTTQPRSPLVES